MIPEFVNKAGGWASDIVRNLWGSVNVNDQFFFDLNDRVMKEVQFPCVIFAKFTFGIVAIDCNDCSSWIINDERIHTYIKLQFDPSFLYPRKVFPFTYCVYNSDVERSMPLMRDRYAKHPKAFEAWGRFIAVSLSRFHISHAMKRLGISGGAFALTCDGYDDHALDTEYPRSRMPSDEYFDHILLSLSVIDACGFGDMTHRAIECFGIGALLIRPEFKIAMREPLKAGIHYLDCGEKGERLKECVDIALDRSERTRISENALAWYQRNCTPDGMRRLLAEIIAESVSDKRSLSRPKKFDLIIGLYGEKSQPRREEITSCLRLNLRNPYIRKIHVFIEEGWTEAKARASVSELNHPKITVVVLGSRLKFKTLFDYANDNLSGANVIVSNNDILFTAAALARINWDIKNDFLALTRWDMHADGPPTYFDCDSSQDAWIFSPPMKIDVDFYMGCWGCDGLMTARAMTSGRRVLNPSLDIKILHNHISGHRNFSERPESYSGMALKPILSTDIVRGDDPAEIAELGAVNIIEGMGYNILKLGLHISSHTNLSRPFTEIPKELIGRYFSQVVAWNSKPWSLECTADGVVYILDATDWGSGLTETIRKNGFEMTSLRICTQMVPAFNIWSKQMQAGEKIDFQAQAAVVADKITLSRL